MSALYEFAHPYYCAESNYYSRDPGETLESWQEFTESGWYDGDRDLNLLFRWDWHTPDPSDYDDGEEVPGEQLHLFFMLQRKGIFAPVVVNVERTDEPAIREWLASCWPTMQAIWAPIGGPS